MQTKKALLALALIVGLTATSFAQDTDKKMKKQLERVAKSTAGQLMKFYEPAKLTDEQKESAMAVIKKHAKKIMEARKAQDGVLTADQKTARKEAIAAAKKEGVKGNKVFKAGFDAMKLSEEEAKKFDEARKKVGEVMDGIKKAINEELTDEQKKAVMSKGKKGKGKGKGKKGKGKDKKEDGAAGKTQTVSVKLPSMT